MKLSEAIKFVDDIKPNAFTDETKTCWINQCEGLVQTEVMLIATADIIQYTYEENANTVLLTAPPHDKIYLSYLMAMVDFANGEYNRYQNTMELFETQFKEYMRWFTQKYRPADGGAIDEGYYISAYGIAVKNGFNGTEEEWLETLKAPEPEMQFTGEKVQWKLESENDWNDLIDISDIQGEVITQTLTQAQEAKEAAESAKTGAETAQRLAESARDLAGGYSGAAQTAKEAAQAAQTGAETAKTGAETAKTGAENAKDLAAGYAAAAETAKEGAQTAKTGAETAKTGAESSASDSEAYAVGKRGGVDVAAGDPAYKNNAKYYSQQAQEVVGGDFATKTEAQGYVSEHNVSAEAHAESFAGKVSKAGDTMTGALTVPELTVGDRSLTPEGQNLGFTAGTRNIALCKGSAAVGINNVAVRGSLVDVISVDSNTKEVTVSAIDGTAVGRKVVLIRAGSPAAENIIDEIVNVDVAQKKYTLANMTVTNFNKLVILLPVADSGTAMTVNYGNQAFGTKCIAISPIYGAHAEGFRSIASGTGAHAEGMATQAQGTYSHAEGRSTKALGADSHAEGSNTIAAGSQQHVEGIYNIEDSDGNYAHIIGNGTYEARSNAHTVDWDGNAWYGGKVSVGTAESPPEITADNDLATKKYVDDTALEANAYADAKAEGNQTFLFQNITLTTANWANDSTYADYSYRGSISAPGVTADMIPSVTFSPADAASGNFAPVCQSGNGHIYIYSKTIATGTNILTASAKKGVTN